MTGPKRDPLPPGMEAEVLLAEDNTNQPIARNLAHTVVSLRTELASIAQRTLSAKLAASPDAKGDRLTDALWADLDAMRAERDEASGVPNPPTGERARGCFWVRRCV